MQPIVKLAEALRDRLVYGIMENFIQRRLLTETELSFPKAIQIAQGMEAARRDVFELQANQSTSSVEVTPSATERPYAEVHNVEPNPNRQKCVHEKSCQ